MDNEKMVIKKLERKDLKMDLIPQLQNDVIDPNVSISTALRRAKVLAFRVNIEISKNG
jgi:hypothetical protein